MFDEMELQSHVEYDAGNGTVIGGSTFPDNAQPASKALVLMSVIL